MPHDVAFHLGLYCLPKYAFMSERFKRPQQLSLCRDEFIEHIRGNDKVLMFLVSIFWSLGYIGFWQWEHYA